MEEEKKFTIYLHRCPNGKCYVGMTSQTTNQRWRNGQGYKKQSDFYNAITLYGWENIEHIIIEEGLSMQDACDSEKYNIKKYNCIFPNGYNIAIGGDVPWNIGYGDYISGDKHPNYGKKLSKEWGDNISKGKKIAFINNPETKPIGIKNGMYGKKHSKEFIEKYCFSHNLKKVYAHRDDIWFNSIKECSKYYNINYTYLVGMLQEKQKMNEFVYDLKLYINGIKIEYEKSDISKNLSKKIVCEDIVFNSVMECAKYYKVGRACISATLKNMETYKRGKWLDRGLRYYNPETDSHLPIYIDTKNEV